MIKESRTIYMLDMLCGRMQDGAHKELNYHLQPALVYQGENDIA